MHREEYDLTCVALFAEPSGDLDAAVVSHRYVKNDQIWPAGRHVIANQIAIGDFAYTACSGASMPLT